MNPEPRKTAFPIGILIVVLVVVVAVVIGLFYRRTGNVVPELSLGNPVSGDILYLTQPVNNFYGKIDKVSDDTLTISNDVILYQGPPIGLISSPSAAATPAPPKSKKLSYTVKLSSQTRIFRQTQQIPYVFKNTGAPVFQASTELKIGDLKVGDFVNASSNKDLRTVTKGQFEAVAISIQPQNSNLSGRVKEVKANGLVVSAYARGSAALQRTEAPTLQDYEITVNSDTEIVRLPAASSPTNPVKAVRASLSDIKAGAQVMVYTDPEMSTKALFISIQPQFAAPSAGASGSAKIVPPNH